MKTQTDSHVGNNKNQQQQGQMQNQTQGQGKMQTAPQISDDHYAVISTIYHALQGCETTCKYEEDARRAGNEELAKFFVEVQREQLQRVETAKRFLKDWIVSEDQGRNTQASMQSQGQNQNRTNNQNNGSSTNRGRTTQGEA